MLFDAIFDGNCSFCKVWKGENELSRSFAGELPQYRLKVSRNYFRVCRWNPVIAHIGRKLIQWYGSFITSARNPLFKSIYTRILLRHIHYILFVLRAESKWHLLFSLLVNSGWFHAASAAAAKIAQPTKQVIIQSLLGEKWVSMTF